MWYVTIGDAHVGESANGWDALSDAVDVVVEVLEYRRDRYGCGGEGCGRHRPDTVTVCRWWDVYTAAIEAARAVSPVMDDPGEAFTMRFTPIWVDLVVVLSWEPGRGCGLAVGDIAWTRLSGDDSVEVRLVSRVGVDGLVDLEVTGPEWVWLGRAWPGQDAAALMVAPYRVVR